MDYVLEPAPSAPPGDGDAVNKDDIAEAKAAIRHPRIDHLCH